MPKIRGVKPDLWTDEDFVELSPYARLLWIGLWNFACDNGHIANKSRQIKMRILPTDDVNCAELLREIASRGLIQTDEEWITVPNLTRHQKVDRRYFTTCEKEGCDDPPETVSQRESRRAPNGHTADARRAHTVSTSGALGDGEVKVLDGDGDRSRSRRAPQIAIPEGWKPNAKHQEYANERRVDLSSEAFKFRNHALSHDRRAANWNAAFTNWLAKAAEFAPAGTRKAGDRRPEGW